MFRHAFYISLLFLFFALIAVLSCSQTSPPATSPDVPSSNVSGPVATFKASARMVTLEVVVKDRQGHHVPGLSAADFHVFEQIPSRGKHKYEQKIAAFREVKVAQLAAQAKNEIQVPEGFYANAVTLQKNPVPPTIILVDGLNTEVKDQAQVHVQMLRMLKALPPDVPVSVFLLGYRLHVLQDFTSDPKILQTALNKAITVDGVGLARIDPRDDPDEVSARLESIGSGTGARALPEAIDATRKFEQFVYAANMDRRVDATIDALTTLSRHLSGYPGRKNLLWISTAFPIHLIPLERDEDIGRRNYWLRLRHLANALGQTKVAVYPINPAGVQTTAFYGAGYRPRDLSPEGVVDTLNRDTLLQANEQDTMEVLAEGTGGKICTGDNDLGDCVRKAVDDSSEFYEIAYYPDSQNWNGEFRSIMLTTKQAGLRLAYRAGYFAQSEASATPGEQHKQLQSACEDYLDATAIPILARTAVDSPDKLTFNLRIGLSPLTLIPTSDDGRELKAALAICTFDEKGIPRELLRYPIDHKWNAQEYQSVAKAGALQENIFIPGPRPAAVRLLVMDIPSGRLGSLRIRIQAGAAGRPPGGGGKSAP